MDRWKDGSLDQIDFYVRTKGLGLEPVIACWQYLDTVRWHCVRQVYNDININIDSNPTNFY